MASENKTKKNDYRTLTLKLHEEVTKLLEDPEIKQVIGWKIGSYGLRVSPTFVSSKKDIQELIWSPFCINSLATYPTLEEKLPIPRGVKEDTRKHVVMVKGCDSRGLVQMFAEHGYPRERIIVLGIPCTGQIDPEKIIPKLVKEGINPDIKLTDIDVSDQGDKFKFVVNQISFEVPKIEVIYDKCSICRYPNPIIHDILLTDPVAEFGKGEAENEYAKVNELALMTDSERWSYWAEKFERCIRCYACREICPVCYCKECLTDKWEPDWINKSVNLTENTMFHITRAFHMAGRCIGCYECERACPVGIPLLELYKILEKELVDNFNFEPGTDPEAQPLLATFKPNDPGEFIL